MNVHDRATRDAALDRALGRGTRAVSPVEVVEGMLASAGDDADLRASVRTAAEAVYGPEVVEQAIARQS